MNEHDVVALTILLRIKIAVHEAQKAFDEEIDKLLVPLLEEVTQ